MEVTRIYKNSSDESIRIDSISMRQTTNSLVFYPEQITYSRKLSTEKIYESTDRVVTEIVVITDADSLDYNPSVPNNYNWVKWTSVGVNGVLCNMSDLPQLGDTV